jgi:hypothetical protein
MARLGEQLERLPATRRAFLHREITWTEARVIGGIASAENEAEWLAKARTSTVRELKAAAREAREAAKGQKTGTGATDPAPAPAGLDAAGVADHAADEPTDADAPRRRSALTMPAWMIGKLDAVLELTSQVAGANVPPGTRMEFIAAEFLSGAEAAIEAANDVTGLQAQGSEAKAAEPTNSLDQSGPPEDPRGYRQFLEKESGCWHFLPAARSPIIMKGPWAAVAQECVELSREDGGMSLSGGIAMSDGRSEVGVSAAIDGRVETGCRQNQTVFLLHRKLEDALQKERAAAWQLGRLLGIIRNRRLWKDMMFCSFPHYVSERLGISSRVAQRLIRLDRCCGYHPPLEDAYQRGELSVLKAELLLRVFFAVRVDDNARRAWVEYAKRATFQRLTEAAQWAERESQVRGREWQSSSCFPPRDVDDLRPSIGREDGDTEQDGGGSPMFVVEDEDSSDADRFELLEILGLRPRSELDLGDPAGCSRAIWMTEGERGVFERAFAVVRLIRGPDWPHWACLNDLLDHFLHVYDAKEFRAMREKYPLFDRDGWRCQVPGCGAQEVLHLHHIVFRSHGGSDEPDNLVTLCDFHHLALHRGWISCQGQAPHRLYWELGIPPKDGEMAPGEAAASKDGEAAPGEAAASADGAARNASSGARAGDSSGAAAGASSGAAAGASSGAAAGASEARPNFSVARILGHRRLRDDEWWDGKVIRSWGDRGVGPGLDMEKQAA